LSAADREKRGKVFPSPQTLPAASRGLCAAVIACG
jgi:hypothetical protein